jgi:hypothetical protein
MAAAVKPPVVAPVTLTDQTCRPATGFARRSWLRALVALNVPHARVGRRVVCRADDWAAAISRAAGAVPQPAALDDDAIVAAASRRGGK